MLLKQKMLILVTGASRGIGLEVVKNLSKRTGTMVIAASRNPGALEAYVKRENTHSILPLRADVSTATGRKKIVSMINELGWGLDGVVNNAGVLVNKPFLKLGYEELENMYAANVFAPFAILQQLVPLMHRGSHIVNITSMGGVQGSAKFSGLSGYSSSKAALNCLSECLAEELRGQGISVNALALGAVQTEMLEAAFPGYKAPLSASRMAEFISEFTLFGQRWFNGKVIPVSMSTP